MKQQWRKQTVGGLPLFAPDYVTMAHNGGKVSLTHRPFLPPGNAPGTHFR